MNIKILYNIMLVRLNIRKVLPKEAVRKIRIKDNGEELLELNSNFLITSSQTTPIFGRKTVIKKLEQINIELKPLGYKIAVFSMFRDRKMQIVKRLEEYKKLKLKYPSKNPAELEILLDKMVSNIIDNNVGGHQTGGAIDLTLFTLAGKELDMGTKYLEFNSKTKTYSNAKELTREQCFNRDLLFKFMKKQGFVNYPNEWWHFSYGDTMWSAYKNKKIAFYGETKILTTK